MNEKDEIMRSDLRDTWERNRMRKCVCEHIDTAYVWWLEEQVIALHNKEELAETSTNTGSPKLPLFEEIWNTLKHELYNPSDNLGGVEYLIKGQAERVYEFIERQLRASA